MFVINVSSIMNESTNLILPHHLAIIMDGNGRWATGRGFPRVAGHKKGADSVRTIVTASRKLGIKVLTLFAFSSQNWQRPTLEVEALMSLLAARLVSERPTILNNGIRLTAIGDIDLLPKLPRNALKSLIEDSKSNTDMTLCLCLSYGGREEIIAMTQKIANKVQNGEISPDSIDENTINQNMWSSELGPVDLLIRTSGEERISNFLLWSIAYSELYFTDCYWPDFDEAALKKALLNFSNRSRRFGIVK